MLPAGIGRATIRWSMPAKSIFTGSGLASPSFFSSPALPLSWPSVLAAFLGLFGVFPGLGLGFLDRLLLVAFRGERGGQVAAQHDGVDVAGGHAVDAREVGPGEAAAEVGRGGDVEVFAAAVEDREGGVAHAVGEPAGLAAGQRMDENRVEQVGLALRPDDPGAVGRPARLDRASVRPTAAVSILVGFFLSMSRYQRLRRRSAKASFLLSGDQHRLLVEGRRLARHDLAHLALAAGLTQVERVFARLVGEVGDPFAVRRPGGSRSITPGVWVRLRASPFSAGTVRISPRASNTARRAGRRDAAAAEQLADLGVARAHSREVAFDLDRHLAGGAAGGIEEEDRCRTARRPARRGRPTSISRRGRRF